MRVCQFRHFGIEKRQGNARRGREDRFYFIGSVEFVKTEQAMRRESGRENLVIGWPVN
jgi:hypothetical protein